jgi:hypothetical protein
VLVVQTIPTAFEASCALTGWVFAIVPLAMVTATIMRTNPNRIHFDFEIDILCSFSV